MVIEGIGDLSAGNSATCKNSLLKLIANLGTILNKHNGVVLCLFLKRGKSSFILPERQSQLLAIYFLAKQTPFKILTGRFLLPDV